MKRSIKRHKELVEREESEKLLKRNRHLQILLKNQRDALRKHPYSPTDEVYSPTDLLKLIRISYVESMYKLTLFKDLVADITEKHKKD